MTPEEIRLLYDYNSWANHRLLEACGSLSEDQFTRNLGSSFRSVRDTLAHIMGVEWLWLERWHGRSPTAMPSAGQFPTLRTLRQRWAGIEKELLSFIAGLTPADVAQVLSHRTTEGKSYSQPLWQMLQHLVNHGSYHRGQITTMLRQLGAKAISNDLIVFYRERAGQTRS